MTQTPDKSTRTPTGIGHVAPDGDRIVPELWTSKKTAKYISAGERTLWAWSRSGICPAPVKIGIGPRPAVRFVAAEIRAWVKAGCPRCDGRDA